MGGREVADPVGLVLVALAGLIIRWSVSHAGKTKHKIIVLDGGNRGWDLYLTLWHYRSDGGSTRIGVGSSSTSSSTSGGRGRVIRKGETGSIGISKLALNLGDRK